MGVLYVLAFEVLYVVMCLHDVQLSISVIAGGCVCREFVLQAHAFLILSGPIWLCSGRALTYRDFGRSVSWSLAFVLGRL